MMFKQQQQRAVGMELRNKRNRSFQKEEKVAMGVDDKVILDLSGMSLDTLPVIINPSLNITLVTTLDLSSNFLKVCLIRYGLDLFVCVCVCIWPFV